VPKAVQFTDWGRANQRWQLVRATGVLAQVHTAGRVKDAGNTVQYSWPGVYFEGRVSGTGVGIVLNGSAADYDVQVERLHPEAAQVCRQAGNGTDRPGTPQIRLRDIRLLMRCGSTRLPLRRTCCACCRAGRAGAGPARPCTGGQERTGRGAVEQKRT
jgi:hypothetical protein